MLVSSSMFCWFSEKSLVIWGMLEWDTSQGLDTWFGRWFCCFLGSSAHAIRISWIQFWHRADQLPMNVRYRSVMVLETALQRRWMRLVSCLIYWEALLCLKCFVPIRRGKICKRRIWCANSAGQSLDCRGIVLYIFVWARSDILTMTGSLRLGMSY